MTTTVDDALEIVAPRSSPRPGRGGAPWRFAARLARREVRRRPGRTLLVMLLVMIPVCAMTVITVLVRTNQDSPAEAFARRFGSADLVGLGSTALGQATAFPAGTRVVRGNDTDGAPLGLIAPNGTARLAEVTDLDLNDPMLQGAVLLRSGRFPARAGEALLTPKLARAFGVGVGDTLRLDAPKWTEKIVGIGVRAVDWNEGFLAVRGNEIQSTINPDRGIDTSIELVDLPGRPSVTALAAYPNFMSRASLSARDSERAVNWILVGGIVALAIIGIVISGAFAVGARRQLVTLGQLSANGADERLLRRTLSLQGFLSGAIGTAAGFVLGILLLVVLRGHFSAWIHHDPGPYVWSARDTVAIVLTGVATATIAAFIPARSAARVPVLSALAGRRPLGELPKRLVPIGAALFAGGIFVLVLVATASGVRQRDGLALSAVFGGLLVLAGSCCASSVVVAALGNTARAAKGAARVAIRSVVRNRARSAAVVMALAAVNAGAVAMSTALDSRVHPKLQGFSQLMPNDTLIVSTVDNSGAVPRHLPLDASVERSLRKVLPGAQWSVRRVVESRGQDYFGNGTTSGGSFGSPVSVSGLVTIADPAVLEFIGLSRRDTATLQRTGVIALQVPNDDTGKRPLTVQAVVGDGRAPITVPAAQDSVRATGDGSGVFITEAKARALKLPIVDVGEIVRSPKPFNESQRASIEVIQMSAYGRQPTSATEIVWSGTSDRTISEAAIRQIVLAIVLFCALVVLAMSLALSAAETRDERDVLVSLGARPSTMRAVSGWKAGLLAVSGALVAIPTGFIPVAVVYMAVANENQRAHIAFPWSTTLQLVVIAPLIAALVAYIGSTIAQAVRPTRMSTFATD